MRNRFISIRGARVHNLKGIDVDLPRDRLVVITGLSGSGKSSLAFDTVFAEGQRRYVESLSAYARQFLEQMEKPDVDLVEGLPPTLAIEQRSGTGTPRSTVATTTEIYDFLRLLFARVGKPHCPTCGRAITQQTPSQMVDRILELPAETKVLLLAPLVRGRKGEHRDVLERARREGYVRVRVDGEVFELRDCPTPGKFKKHEIEAVVDRLTVRPELRSRLADSVETALGLGDGLLVVSHEAEGRWRDAVMSRHYACTDCGVSLDELTPRLFSFNSPYGACPACDGLGTRRELDPDLVVPDPTLPLDAGAIEPWRPSSRQGGREYQRLLEQYGVLCKLDLALPFNRIDAERRRVLLRGTTAEDVKRLGGGFEGVLPDLARRYAQATSENAKRRIQAYMSELTCDACDGARLRKEALAVELGGQSISKVVRRTVDAADEWIAGLSFQREAKVIARPILKEIRTRLAFLRDVGLGYLNLDRASATLSGGEAQRIRLASQVGSGLVGVCYCLDEPTIGLHPRDSARLLTTLKRLRDLGNTLLVVEHDEETIREADHVVEIGPGAGLHGGRVVAQGTVAEVAAAPDSPTGQYLRGALRIEVPARRRPVTTDAAIEVRGARANNLKNLRIRFPVRGLICVTGVSGSGKSTLVNQILLRALYRKFYKTRERPGEHERILGTDLIDKVVRIDQSPIGRTPRSNPATYTGIFDETRKLFALVKEARLRGYRPSRFSFNLKGGRCDACEGQGIRQIEMHFLPDVFVTCEECRGRRYNRETLEVKYKGKSIADCLDLRVEEASGFFANFPKIRERVNLLDEVGLGYVKLGQSSTTLSGGEAQRVKLAGELGRPSTGHTLYVLDEPTTGLHFADISRLLSVLHRLVELGNTVLVIEHNPHVIKVADWVIDLGPEGGAAGGELIAEGRPEDIARAPRSHTGRFLRPYLALPEDAVAAANGSPAAPAVAETAAGATASVAASVATPTAALSRSPEPNALPAQVSTPHGQAHAAGGCNPEPRPSGSGLGASDPIPLFDSADVHAPAHEADSQEPSR
ncbi:MAG: excinuclease ABC subunit UvrA [Planctomycetes bacterium]|nr:excinuclease ABC subunit UvrA [Planctomycetota bacterium]